MRTQSPQILWFENIGRTDVARVGGKNSSLGEMVRSLGAKGVKVPPASRLPLKPIGSMLRRTGSDP
jgi:hypothetical protein